MLFAAFLPHFTKLKTSSSDLSHRNWHYALHSCTCLNFWLHAPFLSRNLFSCMITGVTNKQCLSEARNNFSKFNLKFVLVSCIDRRKLCRMSKAWAICSQYKIRLYKYTLCDVNCARSFLWLDLSIVICSTLAWKRSDSCFFFYI